MLLMHWFHVLQFLHIHDLVRLRNVCHELHDIIDDGRLINYFSKIHMSNRITGNWLPVVYSMNLCKRYSWNVVTVMDVRLLKYGWNWRSHPYTGKFICRNLIVFRHCGFYHCLVDKNYVRFKDVLHDRFMVLVSREPYGVIELHDHDVELNDVLLLLRLMG